MESQAGGQAGTGGCKSSRTSPRTTELRWGKYSSVLVWERKGGMEEVRERARETKRETDEKKEKESQRERGIRDTKEKKRN